MADEERGEINKTKILWNLRDNFNGMKEKETGRNGLYP